MAFDRLGYIGLGDCPTGLEHPAGDRNREKLLLKNKESSLKERCHERYYTPILSSRLECWGQNRFSSEAISPSWIGNSSQVKRTICRMKR